MVIDGNPTLVVMTSICTQYWKMP